MASAVLKVDDGCFTLVLPSAVAPSRSSRKIVTTRRSSSMAGAVGGSSRPRPISSTRTRTISTSSSRLAGRGSTTVLNRRRRADDRSLTPLSRSLAVAIRLNPWTAWTSLPSSGTGSTFSDSTMIRASCTSEGMRVSSSTRTIVPRCIARITGLGTMAASLGPSASSRA